jgi:hypothetical protein
MRKLRHPQSAKDVFGINREQDISTCTKEKHKENTPFIMVSTIKGKDTRARVYIYIGKVHIT